MVKQVAGKAKPKTILWWVGLWATIWWGVSGFFVVILLWQSRNYYVYNAQPDQSNGFLSLWGRAISHTYTRSNFLKIFLLLIVSFWIAGCFIWLRQLRAEKISYKDAFKDLFLTIRK